MLYIPICYVIMYPLPPIPSLDHLVLLPRVVVHAVDDRVDAAVQYGSQVQNILHQAWYLHQHQGIIEFTRFSSFGVKTQ